MSFMGDLGKVALGPIGFVPDAVNSAVSTGWSPQAANIQQPVNAQDVQGANAQSQNAIAQQQAFLNALQAQGGLGNQASVFGQQQQLANQLQQQSMGQGPNPAQQALANATGQNMAGQAALMASQRGAGANAGLLARQASMQGANIQQQAAGQSALMQAQQQLAAQQALAQQQQAMQGVAANQIGSQQQALAGLNQFGQGYQQNLMGALSNQNQANVGMQSNINDAQAGLIGNQMKAKAGIYGGLLNAAGAVAGMNQGGMVSGPESHVAKYFSGAAMQSGGKVPGVAEVSGDSPKNDKVPAVLSPGEVVIPRSVMQSKDPVKGAAEFVRQVMAKKGK